MDSALMWEGIANAALNYIVVSTISSMNSKQTITDVKTDLRTTKEDLMAELKDTRENLLYQIQTSSSTQIEIAKTHNENRKEGEKNSG